MQNIAEGINEIAVVGNGADALLNQLNKTYVPNKAVQATIMQNDGYPLLHGKANGSGRALLYLCKNYACHSPVTTVQQLVSLIAKG